MFNNLPDDLKNYINEFLIECQVCKTKNIKGEMNNCVICKRAWCKKCCLEENYVGYAYFEIYVMTCKECLLRYNSKTEFY
jgi:hypothetical protein